MGAWWEKCTGRFSMQKGSHCKEEKEQSSNKELGRGSQIDTQGCGQVQGERFKLSVV